MKSTQLAYPTAQFFESVTPSRTPNPEKSSPKNLSKLKLVRGALRTEKVADLLMKILRSVEWLNISTNGLRKLVDPTIC